MKKIDQLNNVVTVLARVQEFGPFKIVKNDEELKEFGGFYNWPAEGQNDAPKSVALLAQAETTGKALGVDKLGGVHELTPAQAFGLPTSKEWTRDNVQDLGELKNRKTLEAAGWYAFEEIKEIPESFKGARVYPLAYSMGSNGINGALAVLEDGGRVKLVKSTTRRSELFRII